MNSYRFFKRSGAKPTIIEADTEQEARQIFDDLLLENGINSTSQDFQMLEGASHEEYAKMQNERLPAETAKAVKQAQIESTSDLTKGMDDGGMTPIEKIGKVLGSVFAPYRTEAIASGEEPNMMTSVNDLASSTLDVATFGAGTPIKKGVKSALSWIPKALESTKGATGSGVAQTLNDVTAQENTYGKVDPIRTSIGGILGFMPAVGEAVQSGGRSVAKSTIDNVILPSKAMRTSPNPPDALMGLEQNLFKGVGKYSSLGEIEKKLAPLKARLNDIKAQGINFDLEGARKEALAEARNIPISEASQKATLLINKLFDSEAEKFSKYVPAKTHNEAIPNPIFYALKDEADIEVNKIRNTEKADYTKKLKAWKERKKQLQDQGIVGYKLKQMIGEAPVLEGSTIAQFVEKKPTYSEKSLDEILGDTDLDYRNVDQWRLQRMVDEPAKTIVDMGLNDAMKLKTAMQKEGFSTASKSEFAKPETFKAVSRGINRQIEKTSPEARLITREMAPYMSLKEAIEDRKLVGGSNSPLPLKDLLALQISPLAWAGSKFITTPKGAQSVFNKTKDAKKIGKILGFKPSVATTQYGGNNE